MRPPTPVSGPVPELAEFEDVRRCEDGLMRAVHIPSGREAIGKTSEEIEFSALVIRVSESMRKLWTW